MDPNLYLEYFSILQMINWRSIKTISARRKLSSTRFDDVSEGREAE